MPHRERSMEYKITQDELNGLSNLFNTLEQVETHGLRNIYMLHNVLSGLQQIYGAIVQRSTEEGKKEDGLISKKSDK
jgi:hypothetical protein